MVQTPTVPSGKAESGWFIISSTIQDNYCQITFYLHISLISSTHSVNAANQWESFVNVRTMSSAYNNMLFFVTDCYFLNIWIQPMLRLLISCASFYFEGSRQQTRIFPFSSTDFFSLSGNSSTSFFMGVEIMNAIEQASFVMLQDSSPN